MSIDQKALNFDGLVAGISALIECDMSGTSTAKEMAEAVIRAYLEALPAPATGGEAVLWLTSGEGDGWKETNSIIWDPVEAQRRMDSPQWTVRALYDHEVLPLASVTTIDNSAYVKAIGAFVLTKGLGEERALLNAIQAYEAHREKREALAALPPSPHGGAETVLSDIKSIIEKALDYKPDRIKPWLVLQDVSDYIEAYPASPPQEQEAAPKGEAVAYVDPSDLEWVRRTPGNPSVLIRKERTHSMTTALYTASPSPKAEPPIYPNKDAPCSSCGSTFACVDCEELHFSLEAESAAWLHEHREMGAKELSFTRLSSSEKEAGWSERPLVYGDTPPKPEPEQEAVAAERDACWEILNDICERLSDCTPSSICSAFDDAMLKREAGLRAPEVK